MPERRGKGRFIGSVMGVRPLGPSWWGEGEFKFYRDGDTEFPTIAGTGAEDYVGLSWGLQPTPFLYHGSTYRQLTRNHSANWPQAGTGTSHDY